MKKRTVSKVLALGLVASMAATVVPVSAEEAGGKELKVGAATAPQNISPFTHFSNRQPVTQYLYETLVDKDTDGNYYGIIAKDWSTEDNVTYSFEIYDYVTDTAGNNITAEDCVFSLEHARDEAANTWIASAEVTGDYTFNLTLVDDGASTFPTAMNRAPIVSKKAYEESSDQMATVPVSTSPYVVTDFVPNVSITLEKNTNYWQTDESLQSPLCKQMTVDKLSYTKISEAAQQTIALETGSIDVFEGISNTEVANFLEGGRDADNFTALGFASPISYIFYYANQGICGEDQNLRLAIAHAIDKNVIVQGAFNGLADVPTFNGAPDGLSDLTPTDASDDYFAYDPELAADYLSKSNYNGEQLRLLVPNEDNHNRIAAIVQGQLMAIGLDVAITSYDNAMFQSSFGDGSAWDIAICQMGMADVGFVWNFLCWDLSGGDNGAAGMAVKDEKLKELLTTLNTVDGHTVENATLASDYINEMCYGQNLASVKQYWVFRKDLGATDVPYLSPMYQVFYTGCTVFE